MRAVASAERHARAHLDLLHIPVEPSRDAILSQGWFSPDCRDMQRFSSMQQQCSQFMTKQWIHTGMGNISPQANTILGPMPS